MGDRVYPSFRAMMAANHYASMMRWKRQYQEDDITRAWLAEIFPAVPEIEAPFYLATLTAEDTEYYWHCWRCHENGYYVGQDNADAISHVSRYGHSVRVLITRSFTYKAVNT